MMEMKPIMIIMHMDNPRKAGEIKKIAGELGENILCIGGRELDRTLIGLALGKEIRKKTQLPPLYSMPELLVFVGMGEPKLDLFLQKYRATGLEPVALKAVSTRHNANWTVYELITALQEERASMK